jgi:murein L,D-transpeptidase YcbB/YkuD
MVVNLVRAMAMVAAVGGAMVVAEPALAGGGVGARAPLSIEVDLSARTLQVVRDGETIREYPVAVGMAAHPTPTGTFSIRHIVWNPKWVPPDAGWAEGKKARQPGDPKNPMGRVKLFFKEPDLYLHGTRELDSLGKAESHGCIRLRNGDAIELAKLVMEAGGSAREPSWFHRVLNRVTSTKEVYLSDPVEVRIRR